MYTLPSSCPMSRLVERARQLREAVPDVRVEPASPPWLPKQASYTQDEIDNSRERGREREREREKQQLGMYACKVKMCVMEQLNVYFFRGDDGNGGCARARA